MKGQKRSCLCGKLESLDCLTDVTPMFVLQSVVYHDIIKLIIVVWRDCDGWSLTFAGMGVALLRRSPGQIIVEVSTALTVHTGCVVLAVTLRVNLHTEHRFMKRWLIKGMTSLSQQQALSKEVGRKFNSKQHTNMFPCDNSKRRAPIPGRT